MTSMLPGAPLSKPYILNPKNPQFFQLLQGAGGAV